MCNTKLCVHRAADTIGGNCIEIVSSADERLLLDAGLPLDTSYDSANHLPTTLDISHPVTGVIFSHAHQDHYGLLHALPADWNFWSGKSTRTIISMGKEIRQQWNTWESGEPFSCGSFIITPHPVDHSAFDAHALEISIDGKKIFYSGDFRNHGRKGELVNALIENPPKNIDVLLLEGTNLPSAKETPKSTATENELEVLFANIFKETPGRVFVTTACSNIDRLETLLNACLASNRILVVDVYTAYLLRKITDSPASLKTEGFTSRVKVVVTKRVRDFVQKHFNEPNIIEDFKSQDIAFGAKTLEQITNRWVILARNSMIDDFKAKGVTPTTKDTWIWSLWNGYKKEKWFESLSVFFSPCRKETVHTSGHASLELLQEFASSLNPKIIIPVHGENWPDFADKFSNLQITENGKWIVL